MTLATSTFDLHKHDMCPPSSIYVDYIHRHLYQHIHQYDLLSSIFIN
uniref:Uncharacterized protein n=1 Tax=Arundo donax TaxID=35708 RepID=A0A0A9DSU7_ARUDO